MPFFYAKPEICFKSFQGYYFASFVIQNKNKRVSALILIVSESDIFDTCMGGPRWIFLKVLSIFIVSERSQNTMKSVFRQKNFVAGKFKKKNRLKKQFLGTF